MALVSKQGSPETASATDPYRIMVVDDSAVIRGIFRRTLDVDPQITVVASVSNGQYALDSLAKHPVDVIVLDIEMPVMDGMTALPKILELDPNVKVIMASTLTQQNADISLRALQAGAADYIPKPTTKHQIHSAEAFKRELVEKVKALGHARRRTIKAGPVTRRPADAKKSEEAAPAGDVIRTTAPRPPADGISLVAASSVRPRILCIGSSTGGPKALLDVLGALQPDFDLPIVITQHMPKAFTAILAEHLERVSNRPCVEGAEGAPVLPGRIYVAPGGIHMVLRGTAAAPVIHLDDGPAENFCKPAVDPMLRSVAKLFGKEVLTVILTGMGHDGAAGGKAVVEAGGTVVAQDEETSVVWGMPGAAVNSGICSAMLPISEIARHIHKLAGKPIP